MGFSCSRTAGDRLKVIVEICTMCGCEVHVAQTSKPLLVGVNKENMQLHILEMLAVEDGRSVPGPRLPLALARR